MDTITQRQSLQNMPLGDGERVRLWRDRRFDALECIEATFRTHRYAPHTHDCYVVGIIEHGCETYYCRGEQHYAGRGDFCLVNPGEVHDGAPCHGGYSYRMIYPTPGFLLDVAEDVFDGPMSAPPVFTRPQVRDPELASRYLAAHAALELSGDVLEHDERMMLVLGKLLARHAGLTKPIHAGRERSAITRARDYIDANFRNETGLEILAATASLSRHYFIRAFKREVGLTPHAYVTDRRIREARKLLADGSAPADAAARCGFCDQSHLTRAFKARVGMTPAAFARG